MLTPKGRGELSDRLFEALRSDAPGWRDVLATEPTDEADAQISLWTLYELHYRGFEDVSDALEWDPAPLELRRHLEESFEEQLRGRFTMPTGVDPFAESFFAFVENHEGPSLASFVQREATADQVLELLRHRSIYHLKESDPTAWLIPRLPVRTQAALMELQYDEYGGGDPNKLHAHLFALGLEESGLHSAYGAYIDDVPTEILAQNNAMSLFGLHRRHRGAGLGHLAAFEATSSMPSRRLAQGLARLEQPAAMIDYYGEHIAADAIHEQLAVRTICGSLLEEEPRLLDDVMFGAFTCLDLEDRYAHRMLEIWSS